MAPKRHYNQDPSVLEEAICRRLRAARESFDITPEMLDERLGEKKGLTRRLEAGRASLHLSRLVLYTKALRLEMDDLFADLDFEPTYQITRHPDAPRPPEVEAFTQHFSALRDPEHRHEISELVRSIANSLSDHAARKGS